MSGLTPIIAYQDPTTGALQPLETRSADIETRTMDNIEKTYTIAFKRSSYTRNLSFGLLFIILVVFAVLAIAVKDKDMNARILGYFLLLTGLIIGGFYLAVKSDNAMTKYITGSFERVITSLFPTKKLPVIEGKIKKEK